MIHRGNINLRAVDAEFVGAAHPVQVHVADAVAAAKDGFLFRAVRQTDAGRPVPVVGVDQRAVIDAAICGRQNRIGGGIEIGEHVVTLPARGGVFPTHPKVQGELGSDAIVVLEIEEVLPLAIIAYQVIGKLHLAGQTESEVRKAVTGAIGSNGAAGGFPEFGAGRFAESPGIGVQAVYRVDVHHLGVDDAHLITHFQGMAAVYPGLRSGW